MSTVPISGLAVKCPQCGASLDLSPDSVVYVCRYCGWSGFVHEQQLEVVGVPPLGQEQLNGAVASFVRRKAGRDSSVLEQKLMMVPFWMVKVHAVTRYNGYKKEMRSRVVGSGKNARTELYEVYRPVKGTMEEEMLTALFARRHERIFGLDRVERAVKDAPPKELPQDLLKDLAKRAEFLSSSIGLDEANEWAKTFVADDHRKRVQGMCTKVFDCYTDASPTSSLLSYYPIISVRYKGRDRTYRAVFDGASGKVLEAEVPVTLGQRVGYLLGGYGASLALAAASYFLFSRGSADDGVLMAMVVGMVALGVGLYMAFLATRSQRTVEG